MKRKLVLLDLLLVALIGLAAWQLRRQWDAAKARESAVLRRKVPSVPAPPLTPRPAPGGVSGATYADVAVKALTFKDRNSNVIVDVAPPPPPKQPPPLPTLLGIMNLGDGPSAVMIERNGAPNKEYKAGDQVGEFKLVAIHRQQVELTWDNKKFTRNIEMIQQAAAPEPEQAAPQRSAPATPPAPVVMREAGPGVELGRGFRACVANDSTAPGTVVDGVKKIVTPSPFGDVCRWEPVGQKERD